MYFVNLSVTPVNGSSDIEESTLSLYDLITRLRDSFGADFIRTCSDYSPSGAFCTAIKTLNTENIISILNENNRTIVNVILIDGIFRCFKSWDMVDFRAIPRDLILRFPMESLSPEAYEKIDLDVLVDNLVGRAELGLFKTTTAISNLFLTLPPDFWIHPKVRHSPAIRVQCTGFRFHDEDISEYGRILDFVFNADFLYLLKSPKGIGEEDYLALQTQFSTYNFVLQTFLHELVNGNFDESKRYLVPLLSKNIVGNLEESLLMREISFPEEQAHLLKIKNGLKKCYSYRVFNVLNFKENQIVNEFFSGDGEIFTDIEDVQVDGIIESLLGSSLSLESANVDLLVQVFIMAANEDGTDSKLLELVDFLASNFDKTVAKVLKNDSNLMKSFGNAIQRNRNLTNDLYRKVYNSSVLRREQVRFISEMVNNDYQYAASIVSDEDQIDHSKYAVVFSTAFLDERLKHPPETSRKIESDSWGRIWRGREAETQELSSGKLVEFDHDKCINRLKFLNSLKENEEEESFDTSWHCSLPEISSNLEEKESEEYVHIDYFLNLNNFRATANKDFCKAPVPSAEITFVDVMLTALGKAMRNPTIHLSASIEGLSVSGQGIFRDSLATFGRLLSLKRFKTVEFSDNDQVDGFIPLPNLCPQLMGFIGAWTALCLKNNIPLTWSFAKIFRKFLFEGNEETVSNMVELIYGPLIKSIHDRYQSKDESFVEDLPGKTDIHLLFDLPAPLPRKSSPFLIEGKFLDNPLSHARPTFDSRRTPLTLERFLTFLKESIIRNLLEGCVEFLKYFHAFFKEDFVPFLKFNAIDKYIGNREITVQEVWDSINFNGTGSELLVIDDFDEGDDMSQIEGHVSDARDESEEHNSVNPRLNPTQLMEKILYKLKPKELERFLWFVTGSNQMFLDGLKRTRISFFALKADPTTNHCKAQVCFNQFSLVIHDESAKKTCEKFLESILMSSGFALREF